jgi:hypothetical protein
MVVKTNEKLLQGFGWRFTDYSSKEKVAFYKKGYFKIRFNTVTQIVEPDISLLDKFSAIDIIKFGEELKAIMILDFMGKYYD